MTDSPLSRRSLLVGEFASLEVASAPTSRPVDAVLSFEEVYATYFDLVWRNACALGVRVDSIDDVVQEVFIVVHKKLATFEGRSSFRTWILGITVRSVQEHRRRNKRRAEEDALTPDLVDASAGPAEQLDRARAERLCQYIVNQMREEQRSVFVLAEIEQLSMPEIAAALSINVNTAYSRLRLARERFSECAATLRASGKGDTDGVA